MSHLEKCCISHFPEASETPVVVTCPDCGVAWRFFTRRDRVYLWPLDDRANPVQDILTFERLSS